MKRIYLLTYFVLLMLPAFAQWGQITHFSTGQFPALVQKDNTFLLATTGGVFKSTDQGMTWNLANTGFSAGKTQYGNNVLRLSRIGDRFFALCNNMKIYTSVDEGTTWAQLPGEFYFTDMETSGTNLYALGYDLSGPGFELGVFRSTDEGQTFTKLRNFNNMGMMENVLHAVNAALYMLEQDTIFSIQDGSTLVDTLPRAGLPFSYAFTCFSGFDRDNLVVTPFGSQFPYRLAGNEWVPFKDGLNVLASYYVAFHFTFNTTLYGFGGSGELFRAERGQTVWQKDLGTGLPINYCNFIVQTGPSDFLCSGIDGLYTASSAQNGTWAPVSRRIHTTQHDFIRQAGDVLLTSAPFLHRSTDQGLTWELSGQGLSPGYGINLQAVGSRFYYTKSDGIYRSDNGLNWVMTNLPSNTASSFLGNNGQTIFSFMEGSPNTYYRSEDHGVTFSDISLTIPLEIEHINQVQGNGTLTFLNGRTNTSSGELYVSSDNGTTWSSAQAGIYPDYSKRLYVAGSAVYLDVGILKHLFTWSGSAWTQVTYPPFTYLGEVVKNLVNIGSDLYLTSSAAVYKSSDNAQSWSAVSMNLPEGITLNDMTLLNGTLYLASEGNGIWSNSPLFTSVAAEDPFDIGLYPNPASAQFTLFYPVQKPGSVCAALYAMNGMEVWSVAAMKEEGVHRLQVDVSDLPAGLYFCKLLVNDLVMTRKVVVR